MGKGGLRDTTAVIVREMDRCRDEPSFLIELVPVYLMLPRK